MFNIIVCRSTGRPALTWVAVIALALAGLSVQAQQAALDDRYLLDDFELEELVGRIALYPDPLLGIVLPASTYPLQVVQAARFIDEHAIDGTLQPSPDWDDSVVALLNYPEVLAMMNEDLDWTWALGEAVLTQQEDVLGAIQDFRNRAHAAGNLRSDERQVVNRSDTVIEVVPANPEVIYVPYYEPRRVVVYHPAPVIWYYPRAYPIYYYPYPVGYRFPTRYFWGVTTVFSLGWHTRYVHVHHYHYVGHPYHGRFYHTPYYVRRPVTITNVNIRIDNRSGDVWRPTHRASSRPQNRLVRSSSDYAAPRYRNESYRSDGSRSAPSRDVRASSAPAQRSAPNTSRTSDRGAASGAATRSGFAGIDRERTTESPARPTAQPRELSRTGTPQRTAPSGREATGSTQTRPPALGNSRPQSEAGARSNSLIGGIASPRESAQGRTQADTRGSTQGSARSTAPVTRQPPAAASPPRTTAPAARPQGTTRPSTLAPAARAPANSRPQTSAPAARAPASTSRPQTSAPAARAPANARPQATAPQRNDGSRSSVSSARGQSQGQTQSQARGQAPGQAQSRGSASTLRSR
jgi:hypothetical protein